MGMGAGMPTGPVTPPRSADSTQYDPQTRQAKKERVRGIEPPPPAWKAGALPLSYTRG